MRKLFSFAAAGLAMVMAIPAGAATCADSSFRKLQFFSDDTGGILWQSPRVDSPLDTGTARLMVHVLSQDGNDYAGAFGNCTGIEGKLVTAVMNLSFEFMNLTGNPFVHISAGAPRYSVDLDTNNNGVFDTGVDVSASLAAFHCEEVRKEDTRWSRAYWTSRNAAGCSLFVGSEQFTSNGTTSAWALMAAAHPTWKVLKAYFIMDEEGTTFVDRLAFQSQQFYGSGAPKSCSSEAGC